MIATEKIPDNRARGGAGGRARGRHAQTVYEQLRSDILCLDLKPSGLLDESVLSKRFGMSRSPVREALIRLSMEGLVVTLPNKNTLVAPLNIEEFPAYLDALDLVQRVTTRLAARLHTQSDLRQIEKCQEEFIGSLDANDIPGMIESNRDFHMAISAAARNQYFDILHARLLDDGRRMLHLYFRSFEGPVPGSIRRDHDLMIDAIQARDEKLAEKYANVHVTQVGKRFLGYLNQRHIIDFTLDPPGGP